MKLALAILLSLVSANAATVYVATTGNNANPGTIGSPWRNVWYAANHVSAGDTVSIGIGTWNEYITNTVSGTAGSPITFNGTRGGAGEFLTIIDPSSDYSAGWVAAPEAGASIYKQTSMPWETREMTIGGKRVPFIQQPGDMSALIAAVYTTAITRGTNLMNQASGASMVLADGGQTITWWDTVQACYSASGSTTYLKIRDGSNPNGMAIRCARNIDGSRNLDISWPAIAIDSKNYITWQNVLVRGAFCQFSLTGTSHGNTIQSNYISTGCTRITLDTGPYQNTIANNEITEDYYGYATPGAWDNGGDGADNQNRRHVYLFHKYMMGSSTSYDYSLRLNYPGGTNTVSGNYIHDGVQGVNLTGDYSSPSKGNIVSGNTIDNQSSIGIGSDPGITEAKFYDNLVRNCNSQVRMQNLNTSGETDRTVYFYRNRFQLPDFIGNHFFFHFSSSDTNYAPTIWIYQNSFSGGQYDIDPSLSYQMPLMSVLNNIFSDGMYGRFTSTPLSDPLFVRRWDYNETANAFSGSTPVWYGAHNVNQAGNEWSNDFSMPFTLTAGSIAINTGQDLPSVYPALPQDGTVKVGPAWDMGALEYSGATAPRMTISGKVTISGKLTIQ